MQAYFCKTSAASGVIISLPLTTSTCPAAVWLAELSVTLPLTTPTETSSGTFLQSIESREMLCWLRSVCTRGEVSAIMQSSLICS